jgi:Animal haem peroxidase
MKSNPAHHHQHLSQSGGMDRRTFLRALGSSVVALAGSGLLGTRDALAQRFVLREENFGRLFPQLDPFFERASSGLNAALRDIGKPGGVLDAKDDLDAGPVALIVDPALSVNNPNSTTHTAGTTFMGQFMDHDMTFDLTSRLGEPTEPEDSPNARTPALDLDSVYGGGPRRSPELYEQTGGSRIKFKVESGGRFEDLPRTSNKTAIIADPRNDENLIIAGLHAAFLLFHNQAVDYVTQHHPRWDSDEVFNEAQRLTRWHYQWMIVHEFLPLFIGQPLVDEILHRGRKFYRPHVAFMPVEFQGAAYRFGHTMVRPSYRANLAGDEGAPFFAMIFDPDEQGQDDPDDLRGGARAKRRFVGWQTFFDFGPTFTDGPGNTNPAIRANKQIDAKISTPLFHLPLAAIPSGDAPTALPQRNLLRHVTWSLPSGQSIAEEMGVEPLSRSELKELSGYELGLDWSTPLWYYILKEGALRANGLTLGPVGGRIVGEVIIGLLELNRNSYLSRAPSWKPTLPTFNGPVSGDFRMIDFLAFAGVDPASRGQ